jgi:hypothetical protein
MAKQKFPCRNCGWNEGYGTQGENVWFCGRCHTMLKLEITQLDIKSAEIGRNVAIWVAGCLLMYFAIAMIFGK